MILQCYAALIMIEYIIEFIGKGPALSVDFVVETLIFLYTFCFFIGTKINYDTSESLTKTIRAILIILHCFRYLKSNYIKYESY